MVVIEGAAIRHVACVVISGFAFGRGKQNGDLVWRFGQRLHPSDTHTTVRLVTPIDGNEVRGQGFDLVRVA